MSSSFTVGKLYWPVLDKLDAWEDVPGSTRYQAKKGETLVYLGSRMYKPASLGEMLDAKLVHEVYETSEGCAVRLFLAGFGVVIRVYGVEEYNIAEVKE